MAKRRRSSSLRVVNVGAPRAAAPIIRIASPRAPVVKRKRGRSRTRGGIGGLVSQHNIDAAIGGALYGFAVKSGYVDKLPAIPIVGRTGTAAILLDYLSHHGGGAMCRKAAIAAAVLAGYQLGSEGAIHGDLQTMGQDDGYAGQDD